MHTFHKIPPIALKRRGTLRISPSKVLTHHFNRRLLFKIVFQLLPLLHRKVFGFGPHDPDEPTLSLGEVLFINELACFGKVMIDDMKFVGDYFCIGEPSLDHFALRSMQTIFTFLRPCNDLRNESNSASLRPGATSKTLCFSRLQKVVTKPTFLLNRCSSMPMMLGQGRFC